RCLVGASPASEMTTDEKSAAIFDGDLAKCLLVGSHLGVARRDVVQLEDEGDDVGVLVEAEAAGGVHRHGVADVAHQVPGGAAVPAVEQSAGSPVVGAVAGGA